MLTTRTRRLTGSQEDRNQFLIMLTDVNQECEVFSVRDGAAEIQQADIQ